MKTTSKTETELRDEEVPWPKTQDELNSYIQSLVDLQHDYGTCVYAMSMAATATFNYVSSKLGATGFQASCADLDIFRRTRSMDGPFMLLKAEDYVYPQYSLDERVAEWRESIKPWQKERAAELLKDRRGACPEVVSHWEALSK